MAVVYAIIEPSTFLQTGTAQTIFGSQVELVFLALALICTFVVGEFDLSVAAVMGLSATLVPLLVVDHGWNPVTASAVALAAAASVGAVNGLLVVGVGVDAIVATLGMATFIIGLTLALTNLEAVQGLSAGYSDVALTSVLGLPVSFFYGLAASLLLAYVLVFTPLGLRMSFVGAGHEVARLAGVNVNRIRFGSYVASGAICGVAGIVVTATLGGYDPNISNTYLLPAFAAVFLGTAVIQPGQVQPDRHADRRLLPADRDRRPPARGPDGLGQPGLLRRDARARRRRDHPDPASRRAPPRPCLRTAIRRATAWPTRSWTAPSSQW